MAALTALTLKNSGLMALNRKTSGINDIELEKKAALTAVNRKKAVLTALNWKSSGVTGVEPEKKRH